MEYIVHGSNVWFCCKKLIDFGAYVAEAYNVSATIYTAWSRTDVDDGSIRRYGDMIYAPT